MQVAAHVQACNFFQNDFELEGSVGSITSLDGPFICSTRLYSFVVPCISCLNLNWT